jgi:hypothetical protein
MAPEQCSDAIVAGGVIMKPVIHGVHCWNHPSKETWVPDDPSDVAEELIVDIGTGQKGADMFTIRVATPKGLAGLSARDGIVATRPLIVMDRYDFGLLYARLQKIVDTCEGATWRDCVDELRIYFLWEYEGMKP